MFMAATTLEKELLETLHILTPSQQQQVLSFARSLPSQKGTSGHELLSFAGTIDKDDLRSIQQAIQKDCERIDSNEW
jgi:hypothetical protein